MKWQMNSKPNTSVKEKGPSDIIKENKENETEKVINKNCCTPKTSFDDNDFKDKCSTPKEKEGNANKSNDKENLLPCTKCS